MIQAATPQGSSRPARGRAASSPPALPVNYSFAAGFADDFTAPPVSPPGASNFSCHPSAARPCPVVLVHGTFGNMNDDRQAASPLLANHGYCVFRVQPWRRLPRCGFSGHRRHRGLSRAAGRVRHPGARGDGAPKVDIGGHSQGGMMPRYHLKFLGGAATVHTLVGLARRTTGPPSTGVALADMLNARAPASPFMFPVCRCCPSPARSALSF